MNNGFKKAPLSSVRNQENFGMSVVEAMIMGCIPLLPNRLAYPEILPEAYHEHFLYRHRWDLIDKLSALLIGDGRRCQTLGNQLAGEMRSFLWPAAVVGYDRVLEKLVA